MMPEYENEELTINPTQVFSVHNLTLKPNQPEEPPFTDYMKSIYKLDVHVDSKAPKPSSQTEEVPQGKKPGAKSGLKRKRSLKHTSESTTEESKSQTGQSKKETKSSSAKDKSPNHPSPPTLVVGEMHKEAQQAASGPTSLGATSEEGAHLQLSSGMSAFIIIEPFLMRDGKKGGDFESWVGGFQKLLECDKGEWDFESWAGGFDGCEDERWGRIGWSLAVVKEKPADVTSKVSKGKELDVLKYKRKIEKEY
ncbi:hypothetical protein Tco_0606756 [Tanacetum coccineum]